MENELNFQVKNFGPIHEAKMTIGKINVIGGYNATGKSTVSKLLYCILKASCNNRQDFAYDSMKGRIAMLTDRIGDDRIRPSQVSQMDIFELLENYESAKDEYFSFNKHRRLRNKNIETMDNLLAIIEKNDDSLYLSIIKNLLKIEFLSKNFSGCFRLNGILNDESFDYSANLENESNIDFNGSFSSKGIINFHDVFYLESFSIFELGRRISRFEDYYTR